ncbi:hypothetical protein Tco_0376143, partial [Tanacetum coccineum]
FICYSKGHLKRDCPKKKSSGFVKKGKHDQDSDSSDDEGGSYHMTHRRDFLYDFKGFDGSSVQLGDNRTCTIKGTGGMNGYSKRKSQKQTKPSTGWKRQSQKSAK